MYIWISGSHSNKDRSTRFKGVYDGCEITLEPPIPRTHPNALIGIPTCRPLEDDPVDFHRLHGFHEGNVVHHVTHRHMFIDPKRCSIEEVAFAYSFFSVLLRNSPAFITRISCLPGYIPLLVICYCSWKYAP
jgi:hypothetical protein